MYWRETDKITDLVARYGNPKIDYHFAIRAVCDVCAYEARQAAERAERSAALSAWRANHSPILDGLTYAHGLSAYRGSRSVQEIFRSVDEIQSHPEWELCCTDTIYNDKSLM